jgi:hypothetical protein
MLEFTISFARILNKLIETFSKSDSSLPAPVPQAQVSGGAFFAP